MVVGVVSSALINSLNYSIHRLSIFPAVNADRFANIFLLLTSLCFCFVFFNYLPKVYCNAKNDSRHSLLDHKLLYLSN